MIDLIILPRLRPVAICATLLGFVAAPSQTLSAPDTSPKTEEESHRIRQHGAFPKYRTTPPRRNLHDLLRESHGKPVRTDVDFGPLEIASSPKGYLNFLRSWTEDQISRSDLVLVGQVKRQVCGLTSDESKVISDYYITVAQRICSHDTSTAPALGSTVVVSDLGRAVNLPEGRASTEIVGRTSFEVGRTYLLFLKTAFETVDLGLVKLTMNNPDDYELTDMTTAFVLNDSGPPTNIYSLLQDRLARNLSKLNSSSLIILVKAVAQSESHCKTGACRSEMR